MLRNHSTYITANAKYQAIYFCVPDTYYQNQGFVVVYDFIHKYGKCIFFTGSGEFKHFKCDVREEGDPLNLVCEFNPQIELNNFYGLYNPVEENPHCYNYFRYIKLINFAEYKLSGYAPISDVNLLLSMVGKLNDESGV